jgi:hypothetical protein
MIRHRDVEQLQQLSQAPGQTLTVYLDIDQTNPANRRRQFETRLKDLLKQLKAAHRDDKELAATCSEVEEITKSIKPSGRTLVLARHRKLGVTFRNVIRIAMPSGVYWTNGAFLRPLLEALDENERFGIVLVDQKRARLLTVFMGEIEEHKDLVSQIPPRPESPSADKLRSQPRMQRRHDESVSSHVKFVAREFGKLMEQLEVDRLIVGGNVGVASELAGALPKRLRGRLVEVLPLPPPRRRSSPVPAASRRASNAPRSWRSSARSSRRCAGGAARWPGSPPPSRRSTRAAFGSSSTSRASSSRGVYATPATCSSTLRTSVAPCAPGSSSGSRTWWTAWRVRF